MQAVENVKKLEFYFIFLNRSDIFMAYYIKFFFLATLFNKVH